MDHATRSGASWTKVLPDTARLRHIVYELSREHVQLPRPLTRLADAGIALAANPASLDARTHAHEAWMEMLQIIDLPFAHRADVELLESAERLRLVPDVVARGMLDACSKLRDLESRISQADFHQSPAELMARTGEAMRELAATLDDLALREDRELLPRVQRLLYQHGVALKR